MISCRYFFAGQCAGEVQSYLTYNEKSCIAGTFNGTFTKPIAHCGYKFNSYTIDVNDCNGPYDQYDLSIFEPKNYECFDSFDPSVNQLSSTYFCNSAVSLLPQVGFVGMIAVVVSGFITLVF